MLRFLYRIVLRMHPPSFRERFGEEMLSIFDQCQQWRAKALLVADGFISLWRQWTFRSEYWHPASEELSSFHSTGGGPAFSSLEPFRPRAAAVIHGTVLSVVLFCFTCFAIRYSWIRVLRVRIPEAQIERPEWLPPASEMQEHHANPTSLPRDASTNSTTSPSVGQPQPSDRASAPVMSPNVTPRSPLSTNREQQTEVAPAAVRQNAGSQERGGGKAPRAGLDAAARQRVIDGVIAHLRQRYVNPDSAERMASALLAHEQNGDDAGARDGRDFADLVTRQMLSVSYDKHLVVIYSGTKTPEHSGPTQDDLRRYRADMKRTNCTFEQVEVLSGNIGYLKLNSFPDPSVCQATAVNAMDRLRGADAIIFDLRENRGGDPKMVAFIASYLFDHAVHLNDLYTPATNKTEESWTKPPIADNQLAHKPAYILTSASTFSGAEEFCYDLKMLKRATLVGETTAGSAHLADRYRIDDHFMIMVPEARPVNPISKTDWENVGVEPDVKVPAAEALETARELAEKNLPHR